MGNGLNVFFSSIEKGYSWKWENALCEGPDLNRRTPAGMDPESHRVPKFSNYVNDFSQWFRTKNLSPGYSRAITNYLKKYL